jgi:hypothetical protein
VQEAFMRGSRIGLGCATALLAHLLACQAPECSDPELAAEIACEQGQLDGAEYGESDGADCLAPDSSETESYVENPGGCEATSSTVDEVVPQSYRDCYLPAYDEAYDAAAADAGCP